MQPQQTLLRRQQLESSLRQTLGRPSLFHECLLRPAKRACQPAISRPCIRTGLLSRDLQLRLPMAWHCTT